MVVTRGMNRCRSTQLLLGSMVWAITCGDGLATPQAQAVLSIDRAEGAMAPGIQHQQTKPLTKKQREAILAQLKKMPPRAPLTKKEQAAMSARFNKAMDALALNPALLSRLKHPNLTYTAKSVFTLAGVPMRWGGIGFSGGAFNRAPTQTNDTWPGGISAALPFGDSDKYIGGTLGVSWFSLGNNATNNPTPNANGTSNSTGTVTLVFSRWLGANTMVTAGVINLAPWGVMTQAPKSYNGALTQMFGAKLFGGYHPMSASIGIGTGALGPLGTVNATNDNNVYPFVNGAFNFTQDLAIAGDYYSETFAVGLSYNTAIRFSKPLPLNFMLFAGNLRHTDTAPSTTFGLRVSTGFALPTLKQVHQK